MFFKPTCIGTASHRHYAVKNVSRIPLKFEWRMKHADANVLSVSPTTGVIHPNENQVNELIFKALDGIDGIRGYQFRGKSVCSKFIAGNGLQAHFYLA